MAFILRQIDGLGRFIYLRLISLFSGRGKGAVEDKYEEGIGLFGCGSASSLVPVEGCCKTSPGGGNLGNERQLRILIMMTVTHSTLLGHKFLYCASQSALEAVFHQ